MKKLLEDYMKNCVTLFIETKTKTKTLINSHTHQGYSYENKYQKRIIGCKRC